MSCGNGPVALCQASQGPPCTRSIRLTIKIDAAFNHCQRGLSKARRFVGTCGRGKTIPQTDQLGTPIWSEILRFEADKQHIRLDLLFPTKPGRPNGRAALYSITSFVSDTRAATPPPPKCGSCEGHGRITVDEAVGRPGLGPVSLPPRAFHGLRVAEYQQDRKLDEEEQSWMVQQPG